MRFSAPDRDRLRTAVLWAIENEVSPAYRKFARYVKEDYAPKGRSEPGIWAVPNGDALYRYEIKLSTPHFWHLLRVRATPSETSSTPRAITNRSTSLLLAPRAIRIPISWVRCWIA
jgi:hypothetical protein